MTRKSSDTASQKRRAIKILDKVADLVLSYRPAPKTEKAEKRKQERKKVEKEKRKRESSI